MDRALAESIHRDLDKKIILLTGPRQCGKTTLARSLDAAHDYLSFDDIAHRQRILQRGWDLDAPYVVLDELHKMRRWKAWLKGVYDTREKGPAILVTGSARLDTYRKVGDSLAVRFFLYQLHPLDPRELAQVAPELSPAEVQRRLLAFGGFPEPFLENDEAFYGKWSRSHLDIILRQDLIDLASVRDIASIEMLTDLLRDRVGSPLSYRSLAEDLRVSDKTVKHWIDLLEGMYLVFRVRPLSRDIARANAKKPKFYFYDIARVRGDEGVRLENLVACSLLKECHRRRDVLGQDWSLAYLAKRGGREVDFVLLRDRRPITMIEVKYRDDRPSKNFALFAKDLPDVRKVQLVATLERERRRPNDVEIRQATRWLATW
ncbi:MAG: ATP-binding protein [Deltaproteobacteria bacterium]|nr:ATP-binding protein [Deltaproteobacteria bacterium]